MEQRQGVGGRLLGWRCTAVWTWRGFESSTGGGWVHDGRWCQGVGDTGDTIEKSVWVWVRVGATDVHVHLPTPPLPPFQFTLPHLCLFVCLT